MRVDSEVSCAHEAFRFVHTEAKSYFFRDRSYVLANLHVSSSMLRIRTVTRLRNEERIII